MFVWRFEESMLRSCRVAVVFCAVAGSCGCFMCWIFLKAEDWLGVFVGLVKEKCLVYLFVGVTLMVSFLTVVTWFSILMLVASTC